MAQRTSGVLFNTAMGWGSMANANFRFQETKEYEKLSDEFYNKAIEARALEDAVEDEHRAPRATPLDDRIRRGFYKVLNSMDEIERIEFMIACDISYDEIVAMGHGTALSLYRHNNY